MYVQTLPHKTDKNRPKSFLSHNCFLEWVLLQMISTWSLAASTPSTGWSSTCPATRRRRRSRWTSSGPAPSPGPGSLSGSSLRNRTNPNLERFWYLVSFNNSLSHYHSLISMTLINLHPAPCQWMISSKCFSTLLSRWCLQQTCAFANVL